MGVGSDTAGDSRDALVVVETDSENADNPIPHSDPISSMGWMSREDAHPVALVLAYLNKYGPKMLLWDPATVREVSHREGYNLSGQSYQKIQAAKTLMLVDTFWQRWESFVWCAVAFSGVAPNMDVMQVPSVPQAFLAVRYAKLLRDDMEYTDEVLAYLRTLCIHDHVLYPPPPMPDLRIPYAELGFPADTNGSASDHVTEQRRRRDALAALVDEDDRTLRKQLKLLDTK